MINKAKKFKTALGVHTKEFLSDESIIILMLQKL